MSIQLLNFIEWHSIVKYKKYILRKIDLELRVHPHELVIYVY